MKKFISMVMAAAMVVSLVPATAFAANTASFKVVDVYKITADEAEEEDNLEVEDAQLQIKVGDVDTNMMTESTFEITLSFDGAEFDEAFDGDKVAVKGHSDVTVEVTDDGKVGDDEVTFEITDTDNVLKEDDVIYVDLSSLVMTKSKAGHKATVEVSGDFGTSDALTFAAIYDSGIEASIKKTVDVAVDEVATIKDIKIEPVVGDTFGAIASSGDEVTLKLSKGFEWVKGDFTINGNEVDGDFDDNKLTIEMTSNLLNADEWKIAGLVVEATSAKEGAVATVTIKLDGSDAVKLEVAEVVDLKVAMSVDEDEDVPVFYSGVNSNNDGLTVDDDHEALEVTIEETFAGAWANNKDFTLSLPEGVHVVAVEANNEEGKFQKDGDLVDLFAAAYQEGDHENFEFKKRTFNESDPEDDDAMEFNFTLTLVADPGFVGDVVLTLEGAALDTQEVTIAKFVAPYTVTAEQNNLIIDYRYTSIPTDIVVTEAEEGLWAKDEATFKFALDKGNYIEFEDDAVFTVNEESEMEIDDDTDEGVMTFTVEEESDEEAAVVTISGIELFMQRSIPAGPYDLTITTSMEDAYLKEVLFAPDCQDDDFDTDVCKCDYDGGCKNDKDHECYIDDVDDYSDVAKEAFVNVVTAGRDQDDASFTTKVVVPVGESYIVAGEKQIALDVPAYINAAGYTMLPVRAVATALGINNDAVQWDQATKTVIIMYGQRVITMTAGESVVYVSGTALPASAAVEIVDGRAFLGMRDLARALGVTTINWDAATKTATLN